jgi:hypothetical protein
MKLTSYTFTREELWTAILPSLESAVIDCLRTGDNLSSNLFSLKNNIDSQIQYWCDLLSDSFFNEHKDVSDVLLLSETLPCGTPIKIWMASK